MFPASTVVTVIAVILPIALKSIHLCKDKNPHRQKSVTLTLILLVYYGQFYTQDNAMCRKTFNYVIKYYGLHQIQIFLPIKQSQRQSYLYECHEIIRRREGIAPLILNLKTRSGYSASCSCRFTPCKSPLCPLNWRQDGLQSRSGRLGEEKASTNPVWNQNMTPRLSSP